MPKPANSCRSTDLAFRVLGNTGLARAIAYTLNRWAALARVVEDGRYPIDNNPAERIIRPIAFGRKNWLSAGSETAGKRAAAIMSLIATARTNRTEPYARLADVLTRLPTAKDRDIDSLLPLPSRRRLPPGTSSPRTLTIGLTGHH